MFWLKSNLYERQVDTDAQQHLDALTDRLRTTLGDSNIIEYRVSWGEGLGGLSLNLPQHQKYLHTFCSDFVRVVSASIDAAAFRAREHPRDKLGLEVGRHARLCRARCLSFHGRHHALAHLAGYLASHSTGTLRPFVVHGVSGCGKTALLARAAMTFSKSYDAPGRVLVIRFSGTTQNSSSPRLLLMSVCDQISRALGSQGRSSLSTP